MMYYLGKHMLSAQLGWGPKYTVIMLKHEAHRGLDKVGAKTDVKLRPPHNGDRPVWCYGV
jgi:hypothetical protein